MNFTSKLYVGHVMHRRLRPHRHQLRYRCFWLFLDLDEVPALSDSLRLLGFDRPALAGFRSRDHGDGRSADLRSYVEARLGEACIDVRGGPIRLLTMPRIAGYGFNPLSIFFCHDRDGILHTIIWEVSNAFGERHSYLIPVSDGRRDIIRQQCAKGFYVSPFMDHDLTYIFRVRVPRKDVSVVISAEDDRGPVLIANLAGVARDLTDANLLKLLLAQPFLTLKVIAAIHWEALKLWLKGHHLRNKPPPPQESVTVVPVELSPFPER